MYQEDRGGSVQRPYRHAGKTCLIQSMAAFQKQVLDFVISQSTEAEYKINIKRAITFIYSTSWTYFVNNYLEDVMEKMTWFTLKIKQENTWGINWRNTQTFQRNLETLLKVEADLNKGKSIICFQIRRCNIKIAFLSKVNL